MVPLVVVVRQLGFIGRFSAMLEYGMLDMLKGNVSWERL